MKYLFGLIISGLFTINLCAQDNIVLRTGEEIKAKVEEVGIGEIKYKRTDNPTGPLYSIRKSEVLLINYQNGTKDVFTPNPDKNMHTGTSCPFTKGKADYNTYRKLGIRGIVGGAIMTGIGAPVLLTGAALSVVGFNGWNSSWNPNTGQYSNTNSKQMLAAGALLTAAGVALCVIGPISIKKGVQFRRKAREMKPTSVGFAPIHNPDLDRYSQANLKNKVGLTFTF